MLQGKQSRLLDTMTSRLEASQGKSLDKNCVRMDYVPALKILLTKPLADRGENGIPQVIDMMHKTCLSKYVELML